MPPILPFRARRGLLMAAAAMCALGSGTAQAAFPERIITLVVPTAAGGGNDAMARILAQKMSTLLGQSVVVDNRAGANGSIASEYVARAQPDGYTLMFGYTGTHGMNPALQKLRYDPVTSFTPIGMVCYSPTLMVVNPDVQAKDVAALVSLAKAQPDKLNYASAGNGTAPQFAAELFKLATHTELAHVPYKGSAPAMTDTMAGQTQVMFPSLFSAYPYVKAGKLRALAVAGAKRSSVLPDVRTLDEVGIKGVDVTQWYALFAPAKTPKALVAQINHAMNTALADPEVVRKMEAQGAVVDTSTPEALGDKVQMEVAKWRQVVAQAKLSAD